MAAEVIVTNRSGVGFQTGQLVTVTTLHHYRSWQQPMAKCKIQEVRLPENGLVCGVK